MGKDRARDDERNRIAHLAARIMVEDGVEDFAAAKRKAARQAGVPATRRLPTNEEIEAALKTQQALFGGEGRRENLRELRGRAVEIMHELEQFHPHLTGSVLSGNAGKYADINLYLFTDNVKAVELYLMEHRIEYRANQRRLYCGQLVNVLPAFEIDDEGVAVELVVLAMDDLRRPVRTTPDGKPVERVPVRGVEALLAET